MEPRRIWMLVAAKVTQCMPACARWLFAIPGVYGGRSLRVIHEFIDVHTVTPISEPVSHYFCDDVEAKAISRHTSNTSEPKRDPSRPYIT